VLPEDAAAVDATQLLFDETTGFSAILKVFPRSDYNKTGPQSLYAPMIALTQPDAVLGFPADTLLNPQLFLRNASAQPLEPALALNWRRSDGATGRAQVPIAALAANETRLISLADLQQAGLLPEDANWAAAALSYHGAKGDLLAVSASYEESGRYGLQSPFSSIVTFNWKGSQWHADARRSTLIATGNVDTEPADVEVVFHWDRGRGRYRLPARTLAPGQQLWLNVGDLIRQQLPDEDGAVIPPEVTTGSYSIRVLAEFGKGRLYEGKLVIDKTSGHATYGCMECCGGISDTWLDPIGFHLSSGAGAFGFVMGNDTCGGITYDLTWGSYGWYTVNTAVATATDPWVEGVSPGSTFVNSQVDMQGEDCQMRTFCQLHDPMQQQSV
jgi:hypothetical protein